MAKGYPAACPFCSVVMPLSKGNLKNVDKPVHMCKNIFSHYDFQYLIDTTSNQLKIVLTKQMIIQPLIMEGHLVLSAIHSSVICGHSGMRMILVAIYIMWMIELMNIMWWMCVIINISCLPPIWCSLCMYSYIVSLYKSWPVYSFSASKADSEDIVDRDWLLVKT